MSRAEMSIGCPNCDDRTVEVVTDGVSGSGSTGGSEDQRSSGVSASGGSSDEPSESSGGEPHPAFRDADRLTGTTVDCSNCGDEFEVYFY